MLPSSDSRPITASTAPATTSSTVKFSFDGSVSPPVLANTGTNYVEIVKSLLAYSAWVDATVGNASLLSSYAAPGSTFEKAARHDLDILEGLDRRLIEKNTGPPKITIVDHLPGLFTARYVQHLASQAVVDRHGTVTSEHVYTAPTTTYIILFAQGHDGKWLIADVEQTGDSK